MNREKKMIKGKSGVVLAIVLACGLMLGMNSRTLGVSFFDQDLNVILMELKTYEHGLNDEILIQLRNYIQSHRYSPDSRLECEKQLLAFLESDATQAAKMETCRHLRIIGSEKSVPVLEQMLLQEDTSDMARYVLEKIPGAAVDTALLEALSKSNANIKIGIIASLGQRQVPAAVPYLSELLNDSDSAVASAAATALGHIANPEVTGILSKALGKIRGSLKVQVVTSLIKCAEKYQSQNEFKIAAGIYKKLISEEIPVPQRSAAMKGLIASSGKDARMLIIDVLTGNDKEMYSTAISMIPDSFDESSIQAVCDFMPKLPGANQVQLLTVFSNYKTPEVLAAVIEAVKTKDEMVRIAALNALGRLGDVSTVALLVKHAAESRGIEQIAARNSLWTLRGENIDDTILLNLIQTPESDIQNELIQSIGERRIYRGKSLLFDKVLSSDYKTRLRAIRALKVIAVPTDLHRLLNLLLEIKSEAEQAEMGTTIAVIAWQISTPYDRAAVVEAMLDVEEEVKNRIALYRVLGKIGDDSTLPLLRQALSEQNEEIHDAVVRALVDWPNSTALDDIFRIAETSTYPVHQILSLRAYVRIVSMERYRLPEGVVQSLKAALNLARRPEEQKLILGVLPRFSCKDALSLAESLLEEEEIREEAQMAVKQIKEKLERQER